MMMAARSKRLQLCVLLPLAAGPTLLLLLAISSSLVLQASSATTAAPAVDPSGRGMLRCVRPPRGAAGETASKPPGRGRPWPPGGCVRPPRCKTYTPSNITCDSGTHKCVKRGCWENYDFCADDNSPDTCGSRCEPCAEPYDKFQQAACRTLREQDILLPIAPSEDNESVDPSASRIYSCSVECYEGFVFDIERQTCVRPLPAECAGVVVPDGYWYEPNLDSPYSDIERVGGISGVYINDLATLADACDKVPECAAVNSDGWMKYRVMPRNKDDWNLVAWVNAVHADNTSNPCGGILVKKAGAKPIEKPVLSGDPEKPLAACKQSIPAGYNFVSRRDSPFWNIRQVPLTAFNSSEWAKLAGECDADPACVAVNTLGWMKRTLVAGFGYWTVLNARYPCHGMLIKKVCPAQVPEGYEFKVNTDSWGNDIRQLPGSYWDNRDWPVVTKACSADPKCVAVNTEGWQKHTLNKPGEWTKAWGFPNPCQGIFIKKDAAAGGIPKSIVTMASSSAGGASAAEGVVDFDAQLAQVVAAIAANATAADSKP